MATIETKDGVNLYVKDWGAGRPVIMLHGWPLSSDTFELGALRSALDVLGFLGNSQRARS
jgi:non-heme chloroperoxidase